MELNRKERRAFARSAKRNGVDLDNPDFSIVTAHYTSDYIYVHTEASSYLIDLKNKRALRQRGDEASHLGDVDSRWYEYEHIFSCSVSFPLRMTWKDGDRLILRETTPITRVDELSDEEALAVENFRFDS
jgi:hypothetical protein